MKIVISKEEIEGLKEAITDGVKDVMKVVHTSPVTVREQHQINKITQETVDEILTYLELEKK